MKTNESKMGENKWPLPLLQNPAIRTLILLVFYIKSDIATVPHIAKCFILQQYPLNIYLSCMSIPVIKIS